MKIAELKSIIIKRYPDLVFTDKSDNKNLYFEFSSKTQNDYTYKIWQGVESQNASISAKLSYSSNKEYFWVYPFEPYNSVSSEQKSNENMEFIMEQLDRLTNFKTRIIQKNNLLSQTFICEIYKDNNWMTYYKHSALKTNFVFPIIEGNQKIYQ